MKMLRYSAITVAILGAFGLAACEQPPTLGKTYFVVVPDADGKVGAITVDDGKQTVTLNEAYSVAHINDRTRALEPFTAEQQAVAATFREALAAQPVPPRDFILYFEHNSNEMTAASRQAFDQVFEDIKQRGHYSVEVIGHTDTAGKDGYNADLSLKRAQAISDLLVDRGIAADAISAVGRGERDLLVATADKVLEAKNRRVEITVR